MAAAKSRYAIDLLSFNYPKAWKLGEKILLNEAKTLTKTHNTARNSELAENLILDE